MRVTPEPFLAETPAAEVQPRKPRRLLRAVLVLFTVGVGLFLVMFPWSDSWNLNYLQELIPGLQNYWDEPSLRGGVMGLGLVNLYVAGLQIVQLLRGK
ncbi:MAG TPA: hypothetical protein VIY49_15910 [Bryobacteraceae bacterium]